MNTTIIDNLVFHVGEDNAFLIGCDVSNEVWPQHYRIPAMVCGVPVTEIAAHALNRSGIKKLELPASITKIGYKAFFRSEVEEIRFYAPTECPWQEFLEVDASAFRDCQNLHTFETQQFVTAEYLAFSNCPCLKKFGDRNSVQFNCVHPKAFQDSGVESLNLANNGWLQVDALMGCNISELHLKDAAKIPAKTMDYIKRNGINLHVYACSPLLDLVYEGFSVVEKEIPF